MLDLLPTNRPLNQTVVGYSGKSTHRCPQYLFDSATL